MSHLSADQFAPRLPGLTTSDGPFLLVENREQGVSRMFDLPESTRIEYHLAQDKHGRGHVLTVKVETGADGVPGISIVSSMGTLSIRPQTGNAFYVTSLRPEIMRPEIMPPKLPLEGGEDYTDAG